MVIRTVEIVHENWEVAYFYRENEARIFDAKISVFGEHASWAPLRKMKSVTLIIKSRTPRIRQR